MKKTSQEKLLTHFHPTEHIFVKRCLDWIDQTVYNHQVVITPFLDPREQQILLSLVNRNQDLICVCEGGMVSAERCRVKIGQPFLFDMDSVPLAYLRITPISGKHIAHGQVLGSMLGLGIQRDQVGDIYPHDQGCDVVVTKEMVTFIRLHLSKIGKETVHVDEILLEQISHQKRNERIRNIMVTSLRLDALLSEGFHVSRGKISKLIKAGKCKVDWKITDKPGTPVKVGHLLSLRGYGRLSVDGIEGETKKGRYIVRVSDFV